MIGSSNQYPVGRGGSGSSGGQQRRLWVKERSKGWWELKHRDKRSNQEKQRLGKEEDTSTGKEEDTDEELVRQHLFSSLLGSTSGSKRSAEKGVAGSEDEEGRPRWLSYPFGSEAFKSLWLSGTIKSTKTPPSGSIRELLTTILEAIFRLRSTREIESRLER